MEHKAFYLEKLKEAEHNATSAADPAERERWAKIAEGFRILVRVGTGSKTSSRQEEE